MAIVKILRVEKPAVDYDANGPYRDSKIGSALGTLHNGCPNHPAPGYDFFLDHTGNAVDVWCRHMFQRLKEPEIRPFKEYYCCFDSFHQFNRWFGSVESFNLLTRGRFSLAVYEIEAEHVYFGDRQCMFVRSLAKLVKSTRI